MDPMGDEILDMSCKADFVWDESLRADVASVYTKMDWHFIFLECG